MKNNKNTVTIGISTISFSSVLALIFIILKLTGILGWSWFWVLSPLWISIAIPIALIIIISFIMGLAMILTNLDKK